MRNRLKWRKRIYRGRNGVEVNIKNIYIRELKKPLGRHCIDDYKVNANMYDHYNDKSLKDRKNSAVTFTATVSYARGELLVIQGKSMLIDSRHHTLQSLLNTKLASKQTQMCLFLQYWKACTRSRTSPLVKDQEPLISA